MNQKVTGLRTGAFETWGVGREAPAKKTNMWGSKSRLVPSPPRREGCFQLEKKNLVAIHSALLAELPDCNTSARTRRHLRGHPGGWEGVGGKPSDRGHL